MTSVTQPGYKRTEVGEIPENWGVVRLGTITQEGRHVRYGVVQPGKFTSNGCFMLRSQDYSKGWSDTDGMHRLSKQLETQFKNAKLKTGDLVMTVVGAGIGQIEIIPDWLGGAILSRSTARIGIDNNKAEPAFVRYFLESPTAKRQILDCQKEGAQPVVSCPDLADLHIALPPIEEQKNIANVLTETDNLVSKLDQLITKKRDIQQATMQQLLTGQRRLPGFSGEWEVKRLGEVAPLQRGYDLPNPKLEKGEYPVVYSNGVMNYHSTFMVKGPGVVTGRSGTIGNVHYIEDSFWPHNTSLWVTNFRGNSPKFISYLLASVGLDRFGTGSGVPTLNRNDVHAHKVSFPPSEKEQTAIATILSDMDAELSALEARHEKARQLKQGMMQELLTGRVRLA